MFVALMGLDEARDLGSRSSQDLEQLTPLGVKTCVEGRFRAMPAPAGPWRYPGTGPLCAPSWALGQVAVGGASSVPLQALLFSAAPWSFTLLRADPPVPEAAWTTELLGLPLACLPPALLYSGP